MQFSISIVAASLALPLFASVVPAREISMPTVERAPHHGSGRPENGRIYAKSRSA